MTQPPYLTNDPRPLIMQMDGGRWRAVGLEEGFGLSCGVCWAEPLPPPDTHPHHFEKSRQWDFDRREEGSFPWVRRWGVCRVGTREWRGVP